MTKKRTLAALLMSLMVVMVLSTGAAVNAAEHAFIIEPGGAESWNMKGAAYRGTSNTNNPWRTNLQITTEGGDQITRFMIRLQSNGALVSDPMDVQYGTGFHTKIPYSSANNQEVALVARDNTNSNGSYWIAGQWAPNN